MAFGALKGTLSGVATSITNPFDAADTGVEVAVGDLVFAVLVERSNLTVITLTDNLGNEYFAPNAGTISGSTVSGRSYYSLVTKPGTLTTLHATTTAGSDDVAFAASVHEGYFYIPNPLGNAPAQKTSDVTSPFSCPATGVMSQASNLVMTWMAMGNGLTTIAATSPSTLAKNVASGTGTSTVGIAIAYRVVSSTASVTPEFTCGSNPSADVLGTVTFKAGGLDVLTPTGAEAGAPIIGTPQVSAYYSILVSSLIAGLPDTGVGALAQKQLLTPVGIDVGSVFIDYTYTEASVEPLGVEPFGWQAYIWYAGDEGMKAKNLETGAPVFSATTFRQVSILTAEGLVVQHPLIGASSTNPNEKVLAAADLIVVHPAFTAPLLKQTHVIRAISLEVSFIDFVELFFGVSVDQLEAENLVVGSPVFGFDEQPRIRYGIEGLIDEDTGDKQQTALFINYNSATWIEVKSGLVGAGDEKIGYGAAQRIFVEAPLVLRNNKLYIDVEALREALGLG